MTSRVVVVGGGVAGVSTVAALRANGYDGDLTLVDAGELPYDRPPLSKEFLSGKRDLDQIALQPAQWYDEQSVRLVNRTRVTALRTAESAVELASGKVLRADRVVLATGGLAARLPVPGGDSPRLHTLRTAEDALRLRAALMPGARLLVVGAGLIGAEVASTATDLGCEVTLVDPAPAPLSAVVGPDLAAWLHDMHAARGITTLRAGVTSFADAGVTLSGEDEPRQFDAVVLGVGMVPDTALALPAGLVADRGQVTSHPAILTVGDCAGTQHWEAAQHDANRAAATILDMPAPAPAAPWFWTDRHGVHVEGVGHMDRASQTVLRGALGEPKFAVFGLRDERVVAAAAVNDSHSVRAARRLIDREITIDPGALADPATDLRRLLRG